MSPIMLVQRQEVGFVVFKVSIPQIWTSTCNLFHCNLQQCKSNFFLQWSNLISLVNLAIYDECDEIKALIEFAYPPSFLMEGPYAIITEILLFAIIYHEDKSLVRILSYIYKFTVMSSSLGFMFVDIWICSLFIKTLVKSNVNVHTYIFWICSTCQQSVQYLLLKAC